jgi:hypothetical protein
MKESKHKEIKEHLLKGGQISGLQAIELFGVYRLSSIINRLRNEGLDIKTTMVISSDGVTQFAKYFIPISKRCLQQK